MTPQLCTGTVMHARFVAGQSPAAHRFVYPLFFLALPLSQLQDAGNRWFGIERARPLAAFPRPRRARRLAAGTLDPRLARRRRHHRGRRRSGAADLSAHLRLRLQSGQLLVLP
jgi:DUF1365 family protein